jgi:hypothetical protein
VEGTEQPLHDGYVYAVRDEEAYLQADHEKPPIPREPFDLASIVCQFCGKSLEQVAGVFEAKRRVRDPIPRPSRPCGSATSALPGWRRSSPRNPKGLNGSEGGRYGHVAAPCQREDRALPCPAGRSGPWSRRTGAPEASATGRDWSHPPSWWPVRAGSAPHRKTAVLAGHERSRRVRRNPSSPHLRALDLGRWRRMEAASNPTSSTKCRHPNS